jgi:RecJ-like exonuclease
MPKITGFERRNRNEYHINVKLATRCPKCRAKGTVIGHRNDLLLLECRDCNKRWNTYSKTCKICGKPNYFYVEGNA